MWSSIINAGAGIASSLFGNSSRRQRKQAELQDEFTLRNQQRQYDYQTQLNQQAQDYNLVNMEIQNKYAMENWLAQQEYNSPANQLKRVREAGLNPNALFGNGNISNVATSAPDTPDSSSPSGGSAGSFNTDVPYYDSPLKSAFQSSLQALQASLQYQSVNQDIRNKQATENLTNAQVENTLQNTLKQQEETLSYLLDNQKKHFENSKLKELYDFRVKQLELDIEHTKESISNLHKQSNLHDSNADLNMSRKKQIDAEIKKITADEKYIRVQTKLEEWALNYRIKNGRLPNDSLVQQEASGILESIFGDYNSRLGGHNGKGLISNLWNSVKQRIKK